MNPGKSKGEFFICLPLNKNYAFNTSKTGYLFHSENFALNESKDYQPFTLNIPLSPITKDSTVVLRNVFFETVINSFRLTGSVTETQAGEVAKIAAQEYYHKLFSQYTFENLLKY